MSQAMTGIPKAPEHRAKIAAAQRRRHAAARVLTAVEAFHRDSECGVSSGVFCRSQRLTITIWHLEAIIETSTASWAVMRPWLWVHLLSS